MEPNGTLLLPRPKAFQMLTIVHQESSRTPVQTVLLPTPMLSR